MSTPRGGVRGAARRETRLPPCRQANSYRISKLVDSYNPALQQQKEAQRAAAHRPLAERQTQEKAAASSRANLLARDKTAPRPLCTAPAPLRGVEPSAQGGLGPLSS